MGKERKLEKPNVSACKNLTPQRLSKEDVRVIAKVFAKLAEWRDEKNIAKEN